MGLMPEGTASVQIATARRRDLVPVNNSATTGRQSQTSRQPSWTCRAPARSNPGTSGLPKLMPT